MTEAIFYPPILTFAGAGYVAHRIWLLWMSRRARRLIVQWQLRDLAEIEVRDDDLSMLGFLLVQGIQSGRELLPGEDGEG